MKKKKETSKKSTKAPEKAKVTKKVMTQTHAKEEKFQPSTLDQVWGDTGNTKYGTMDEEKYLNKLQEMNKSDLQAHANRVGMIPIGDRGVLTKKLMSEFKKYVSGFKKPDTAINPPPTISKEAARVLSEGK